MPPREVDPLLLTQSSSLSAYNERKKGRCKFSLVLGIIISIVCIIVLGSIISIQGTSSSSPYTTGPYAGIDPDTLVEISKEGDYDVKYAGNYTISSQHTTFGELASIMLPPWYEASRIALDVFQPDMEPDDTNVKSQYSDYCVGNVSECIIIRRQM